MFVARTVRSTLWRARANSETDRVSDKLFTGFLEGASAIFQSVKVAFLPSEQCLIVVRGGLGISPLPKRKRERESERAEREGGGERNENSSEHKCLW